MLKRSLLLVLLLLTTTLLRPQSGLAGETTKPSATPDAQPPTLRLVESSAAGVTVELRAPDAAALLALPPGAPRTAEPGKPQLPLLSTLVGVPAAATIRLELLADEAEPLAGSHDIGPAPRPTPPEPRDGDLALGPDDPALAAQPVQLRYDRDPVTYGSAARYPDRPARVADDAWLRDQRLVRLELYPLQYSPAARQLTWHRRLLVRLHFEGVAPAPGKGLDPSATPRQTTAQASPFEAQLRAGLLNYDQARAWRERPAAPAGQSLAAAATAAATATTPALKIVVDRDGIYRLTQSELLAAGLPADVNPQLLHLTRRGSSVAIVVEGEDDASFDAQDSVLFFGRKFDGTTMEEKYTDEDVYWLSWGGPAGPRMAQVDATPSGQATVPTYYSETLRVEGARWYWFGDLSTWHTDQDMWYWEFIQTDLPHTSTYNVVLSAPAPDATTASMRADVLGYVDVPHHNQLFINSYVQPVVDLTWPTNGNIPGTTHQLLSGTFPHSALISGTNQIKFVIPDDTGFVERLFTNWFEIDYGRQFRAMGNELRFKWSATGAYQFESTGFTTSTVAIYDITNPLQPRRLLNPAAALDGAGYRIGFASSQGSAEYLLAAPSSYRAPKRIALHTPSDLSSPAEGADYLVITHAKFITTSQQLADYRAAQGMRTRVIDVATLYDEFNHGIYNPIAVKHFLAHAMASWPAPAPSYVVLVGDGHFDMKGYHTDNTAQNYMPPHLVWVDPFMGEVDSSNQLASVVGGDILPDVGIGRMPVNSVAEHQVIVDKIKAYETVAQPAWHEEWRRRVLFFADNFYFANGDEDLAGNFPQSAHEVSQLIPAPYTVDRIYYSPYTVTEELRPHQIKTDTLASERLKNAWDMGYFFINYTGHGSKQHWGKETFLTTSNVASLSNGALLPIVVSMTCLDGYWYQTRNVHSLTETLLRTQGRGAIATFSSTGQGLNLAHEPLNKAFYHAVFQEGAQTLAQAALAGRLATFATGNDFDQIDTYTIFGDPALRLPTAKVRFLPLVAG